MKKEVTDANTIADADTNAANAIATDAIALL